jgi:dihydroxyacetone kinase-like predicted kinase
MSFAATMPIPTELKLKSPVDATDSVDKENSDEQRLVEEFAQRLSYGSNEDDEATRSIRRPLKKASRASLVFFQNETSHRSLQKYQPTTRNRRNSFLGVDGKVQDDYIARRASLNRPTNSKLGEKIPALADLSQADTITEIDGNVLAQLFLSGYAKLGTKVAYLNKINVFPIADGDTGANMKVCLKLPSRNLVLDPSPSVLRVASNMAADVLLSGQGNSGTILSHFYVCLAEEIRDMEDPACHDALTIDEFAACLVRVGGNMASAVPNPVEGTLLSVARDSCEGLAKQKYSNLKELLDTWKELAEVELKATPDKLIVDGVKVLEKAGVVDSGAQGLFYTIEGMWLASKGELPEASDPRLFQTAVESEAGQDNLSEVIDDHDVCDTKYQFCTEAVILLKDGVTKDEVMSTINLQCQEISETEASSSSACACCREALGDSVASVSAPAKEGGNMLKIHIHTNEPQRFFDTLKPYSKDAIFKKEKVEDMKIMRDIEHDSSTASVDNAKFTMIGLSSMCLPPTVKAENKKLLHTFPMFVVPEDTNEPIDARYASDTETLIAMNNQRNPATAVRMTTATSTPMQMKIELLAALSKGKPVLCFVFSVNKKLSAFGRNVLLAVDMLDTDQKDMVKVFVHGWAHDGLFLLEAIEHAQRGQTIDEAIAACEDLAQRTYGRIGFMNAALFRKLKAWRPGVFPDNFVIPEGYHSISGPPATIRRNGIPLEKRMQLSLTPIGMGNSREVAFEMAAKHIKSGLEPGQKLGNVMIPCVGRPDFGHAFVRNMEEEGIEIVGTPYVYTEGMIGMVMGSWGNISLMYKIIEE